MATPLMEDLAAAADVPVELIYDHFGSKDGLRLALAERALAGLSDYLAQAGHYECFPDRIDQAIAAGEADPTLDPG